MMECLTGLSAIAISPNQSSCDLALIRYLQAMSFGESEEKEEKERECSNGADGCRRPENGVADRRSTSSPPTKPGREWIEIFWRCDGALIRPRLRDIQQGAVIDIQLKYCSGHSVLFFFLNFPSKTKN